MPSTPRRRFNPHKPSYPGTPQSSEKKRLNGFYRDGDWWCNCQPRRPAKHRPVTDQKKSSFGQYYYCCEVRPKGCNFFLWEEDAKTRVEGLAAKEQQQQKGSRATNGGDDERNREDTPLIPRQPKMPSLTQQPLTSYGVQVTPGGRQINGGEEADGDLTASGSDSGEDGGGAASTPCPAPGKRKRDVFEEVEEFSDLDSDEERQMAALADKPPQDPKTPTSTRNIDAITGLPTPATARTLFPAAAADDTPGPSRRQKTVSFEETPSRLPASASFSSNTASAATLAATPSSTRHASPPSSPSADPTADEILSLLRPHNLPASTLSAVETVLATASRRNKGLIMGRDAARTAVREKDGKIAKLQERVAALENKDLMAQKQITRMKASLMKMYEDN